MGCRVPEVAVTGQLLVLVHGNDGQDVAVLVAGGVDGRLVDVPAVVVASRRHEQLPGIICVLYGCLEGETHFKSGLIWLRREACTAVL